MASVANRHAGQQRGRGRRTLVRLPAACALMLFGAGFAGAQQEVSIEQVVSRTGNDLTSAYEGREVSVRGQVVERVTIHGSLLMALKDDDGNSLILTGPDFHLGSVQPGDRIVADGVVRRLRGMPVLAVSDVWREKRDNPVEPARMRLPDVPSLPNIGRVITTEGTVDTVENQAGVEVLKLRDGGESLTVVLPKERHNDDARLGQLHAGDRVRIRGVVLQNCPAPPYDSYLEVVLTGPESLLMVETAASLPPALLLTALAVGAVLMGLWWIRETRQASFRQTMRRLNALGEEILGSGSGTEILKKIESVVPEVVSASGVQIFLHNRKSQTLEPVRASGGGESILIETPIGAMNAGVVLCFRNRTLINVPDTWRSQLFQADSRMDLPRSVMFVPMFAQNELVGVMRLHRNDSIRYFGREEQAAAQHLANQTAAALKMQEQRSIREQLFKSEKLAATGQLISGVVNELKAPVETLLVRSQMLALRGDAPDPAELEVLAGEARRTAEIVTRLISFGRSSEAVEAKAVELNELLGGLLAFRSREWESHQVAVKDRRSKESVYAMGVQGQLEQVFLNLLMHAEQNLVKNSPNTISVTTSAIGRRVVVSIAYSSDTGETDPFAESASDSFSSHDAQAIGLGVSRGIVQNHGGDMRFDQPGARESRFEIELPRAEAQAARNGGGVRVEKLTAILLESDPPARRQVVTMLGGRGHRVIPANSADEALDLVGRLRCDIVLCSSRGPGLNWVEFYRRVRDHGVVFVLLTDGYDAELARAFGNSEGFLWPKPFEEAALEKLLADIAERSENSATV